MQYDFETIINRANTGSFKWNQMKNWKPDVSDGIVPFSVADMEFSTPPEIVSGLKEYLDTAVLGYSQPTQHYLDAVCAWMKRRHDWEIKPEWIVSTSSVNSAIYSAVKAFSEPGEGVIIQTPGYYPFVLAATSSNRKVVRNPLILKEGKYTIDFEDLERKAMDPNNKILLFCSPHNPVGRVWTRDELERVGDICLKNQVLIISDEIHFDLIMPDYTHTVFARLSEELANNMIVCTSPSKTFNLAGMQIANIIISNPKIRNSLIKEQGSNGLFTQGILGYKACEIAYSQCEEWMEQVIEVVCKNHLELKRFIETNIPEIKVFNLEGTYLQWMDFCGIGLDKAELKKFLHEQSELFLDEGYTFGQEGMGFERMNLACPTRTMMKGLERLSNSIRVLHKN